MALLREENSYLQEALRKNRTDLENEKRLRKSSKQNKVSKLTNILKKKLRHKITL